MADDITVKFSADDRDLVASYIRQGDKLLKLQEQLRRMAAEAKKAGEAQRKAADDGAKGADLMAGKLAGMAGGWITATGAIAAFVAANKQAIAESEKHAEVLDDIQRKFRVQSGLRGLQADGAQSSILKSAAKAGITKEQAFAAATQLVSSGMDATEASGAGLSNFLDVLGASNQTGKSVDGEGLSKALMQYLESQGMGKTGANVGKIGGQVQTLFKSTNLQLSGLPALAKEGAGLAGAMSPQEQLAAFAKLTGSFDESTSATSLRNYVQRLQTAGSKKDAVASLKKMGLRPEDVDFVGENFDNVTGKLSAGLENVPEKDRARVLKTLFEEAGIAPAKALMNGRADIAKNVALQTDLTGFAGDVRESQAGPGAAGRRLVLEDEIASAREAAGYGLRSQAYQNALREAGRSQFQRNVAGGIYGLASGLGASPEGAQASAQMLAFGGGFSSINGDGNAFVDRRTQEGFDKANDPAGFVARQQEEARKASERNTVATERLTDAIRGMGPRGVPAPGPRPTAGAGRP